MGRRAFGFGVRRAGFGPLGVGVPGFTLRHRLQGQLQLDVLPPGPHERCRPTDPVRRSGLRRRAWRRLSGVLGWLLLSSRFPRSAVACYKSFVFSGLPIRKVVVLSFTGAFSPRLSLVSLLFSASYRQDRWSYYLFVTTCMGRCFDCGKLLQITQARGNKRCKALWPLRGSRDTGESNPARKGF